jgi:hypothetical protein
MWDVVPTDRSTHGTLTYNTHPSLDDALAFRDQVYASGGAVVSFDIENAESRSLDENPREGFADTHIEFIQFTMGPNGSGVAFPWEGRYREIAGDILRSPNTKCGHNTWLFDQRVLKAARAREGLDLNCRGAVHGTPQMFHHWQPALPAHLQFAASFICLPFPWKHLTVPNLSWTPPTRRTILLS